jgi:integrase
MPKRYRAAAVLAAGAGLRQGEIFGLAADRVDFLRRTITIDRQLVTLAGHKPYLAPPKTAASIRKVPLPDFVSAALSSHMATYPPGLDGLLFTTTAGAAVPRNRFGEAWRAAVKRADVRVGLRFHDLRHYYASLLIRHGESVKVVQARLGHKNAAETLDTYSHLWPDSEDRTRSAVDDVLSATGTNLKSKLDAAGTDTGRKRFTLEVETPRSEAMNSA